MGTAFDFLSSLLDEIALEGLDGITLEMLWQRVADRPDFPIALDDDSKSFFWDTIAKHKDIEIYELPTPREFVPVYNRYDHIDPELGVVLEPSSIYPDPYFPIEQVKDGEMRGSCSTYKTRKCVTSDVRCGNDVLLMSLSQVVQRWGNFLVLVASPKVRLLSLIGTEANPLTDFSLEAYCMLERIGRSRYLGEVTQGTGGLFALKAPFCKQLHYYRKKLSVKGLITKQVHYMKMVKGQTSNGCLFHLTRFYVQRKTKMATLMKRLCDILKEKPQNRESCKVLREELGIKDSTFKKLFYRPFQRWVKILTVSCRDFYPGATQKEWFTIHGHEKVVKVVQLVRHCDDEDEDDEEEESNEKERALPLNVHFDSSRICVALPLAHQIYSLVTQAGPEGISSGDLGRAMTLTRLDIRNLLRLLIKKNAIVTMLQDRGRQKVTKYISKMYEGQNEAYSTLKEEEEILIKEAMLIDSEATNHISVKRNGEQHGMEDVAPMKKKIRLEEDQEEPLTNGQNMMESDCKKNIESNFQNIVSRVLEVQSIGKSPKLISFSDKPSAPPLSSSKKQLTYRKLKRTNLILNHLKSERVSTLADLQKYILDKEQEEGYNYKLDKKSTARLVDNLHFNKKLKKFVAELELENERTKIEFICESSLQQSDSLIQVAIEQAKFKYFSVSKDNNSKKPHPSGKPGNSVRNQGQSESTADKVIIRKEKGSKKSFECVQEPDKIEPLHKYPRMTPKYMRAKSLHIFLQYLVHQHKCEIRNSDEQVVYHESMTWKRFVPPLPPDYDRPGWCYLADIYQRMPLSLFLKIVNFRQGVSGLNAYLENEEKANYLLQFLPLSLRNNLLNNRKYLFSTNDVIKVLCYMGLVSIGPQVGKQKDQIFLYVHKEATLKDTTISPPSYIHVKADIDYETKSYTFESEDDVESFWLDLESICFHTPLGKYSAAAGKTIAIMDANFKPELMGTTRNIALDEVSDVGAIPGDGLGAAGYDSGLFLHSRRNWQTASSSIKLPEDSSNGKEKPNPVLRSMQYLLKTSEAAKPESRSRLQRLTKNSLLLQKENKLKIGNVSESVQKSSPQPQGGKKRKITMRTVKMRSSKRMPYYDEKDLAAMEKLDKARCDWSPQEDSFLLLCKVASSFIDPLYNKNLAVPYTVVRDLLHEHVPEASANKSSRACQRRVRYMMMNPTTANNVRVFLGEALQDTELVQEFDKPKPPKTKELVWRHMFTVVLNKLREKFTLPASDRCKNITIPDSLEEFNRQLEIVMERNVFNQEGIYEKPGSVEEIRKFVVLTLILSAMAIVNDGKNWSYLLHKLYQAYPENLLLSAVQHLRREKILAIKKKNVRVDKHRALKSTCPYKFSITYSNAMLTKFPIRIFSEAKELLDNLKLLNSGANIELKGNVPSGYAASVLSLVIMGRLTVYTQIPEQIILFDSSLSKEARTNIVERMINTLSDKESMELSRLLNDENSSPLTTKQEESTQMHSTVIRDLEMADIDPLLNEDLSCSQLSEVQRSSNASRFALYLLRQEMSQPPMERVQHSQDYIVLNSCRVFCSLRHTDTFTVLPVNPAGIIEKVPGQPKTSESECITKDKMELTNDRILEISQLLTHYIPPDAFTTNRNHLDTIEALCEQSSPQTVQDAKSIFHYLYDAGVKGISEKQIWKVFTRLSGELNVFEHLRRFREAALVIRAGVAAFTYVCSCFGSSWVLASFRLSEVYHRHKNCEKSSEKTGSETSNSNTSVVTESNSIQTIEVVNSSPDEQNSCSSCVHEHDWNKSELNYPSNQRQFLSNADRSRSVRVSSNKKIYFMPRTWRHPDGSLNKPVFFDLLSTVLSHIITAPGASISQVCETFALVLPAVQTLEIIEILEKACCIYKYYCKPVKKSTLFSSPCSISITENPEPEDLEHLEPFPDAVCKIAQLKDAM